MPPDYENDLWSQLIFEIFEFYFENVILYAKTFSVICYKPCFGKNKILKVEILESLLKM